MWILDVLVVSGRAREGGGGVLCIGSGVKIRHPDEGGGESRVIESMSVAGHPCGGVQSHIVNSQAK